MGETWRRVIGERVDAIVALLRSRGVQVYWVGLPRMRSERYDEKAQRMNAFFARRMRSLNVAFIDTVPATQDANGRFAQSLPNPETGRLMPARNRDGIHMTMSGYTILTRGLAQRIRTTIATARRQAGRPELRQAASPRAGGAAREADGLSPGVDCRRRGGDAIPVIPAPTAPSYTTAKRSRIISDCARRCAAPSTSSRSATVTPAPMRSATACACRCRPARQWRRGRRGAGRPYANYVTWNLTASQSGGWTATSWTNATAGSPRSAFPASPKRARAGRDDRLARFADHVFDRVILCAVAQPAAARSCCASAARNGAGASMRRAALAACHAVDSDTPAASASVTTEGAGIVSSLRGRPSGAVAAIVSNLGVIGAQLAHFAPQNEGVLRAELAGYRPDLIIIAFGTNEGFDRRVTAGGYEAGLRAQIRRVRRLAGADVPILLAGAPDAATRDPAAGGGDCGEGYYTPALLGEVRRRQRAVARDMGLAFWDWEAAMGGRCASRAWHRAGLMRDDHIHFNRDGGDRIGRMLFGDLVRGAETSARDRP